MKRNQFLILLTVLVLLATVVLLLQPQEAHALPEYSAQTGEPCASCHLSPSGGGPRGPRGQAWVGGGKPGTVPDLVQSLELLGIELDVDESRFQPPTAPPPSAEAPLAPMDVEANANLRRYLNRYDGN